MRRCRKTAAHAAVFLLGSVTIFGIVVAAEQQGNTPQRGQAYESKNDTAHCAGLSAEQKTDQIKSEQADAAQFRPPINGKDHANLSGT